MKLVEKGTTVNFHRGQSIYKADFLVADPCVYLILEGTVEITRKHTPLQKTVFQFGQGEPFGMLEVYIGGARLTEATATTDVHAIGFSRAEFERNMVGNLSFGILGIRVLSRMLRQLNEKIKKL